MTTSRVRTARGLLLLSLTVSVSLAGCFGGRRGTPPAGVVPDATPAPAGGVDVGDSAVAPPSAVDSTRPPVGGVAGDSAARDSAARINAPADSADTTRVATDSAKKPAAPVKPKTRECLLDFNGSPPESRMVSNLLNDGSRTTFIGGGLVAQCQGDPQIIRADSAEQYENAGMLVLVGNVVFEEPGEIRMTSPSASYFTGEEKLVAYGGVVATELKTGSTFSGPTMEYYRAGSRRPFARLYAPQRPSARLVETDSNGVETPPINVTANQMEDVGDTVLVAWGDVVINREQVVGSGDSSTFDKRTETARLIRNAVITSRDTARPFRLAGDSIDMFSNNRVMERVVALHRATATSNDVSMRAERVEMHLDSQRVDHAWAFGPGRAYAETSTQTLEADSLEILMPGQLISELRAVGRALALATPDSLRIRNAEQDVLSGDTIIALFDTATVAPDTSPRSTIREVTALSNASARYQMPSSRGPNCPPGINYVRGQQIVVFFDSGTVQVVAVDSQASGVYLEPVPDTVGGANVLTCAVAGDSAPPDSLADSLRVPSVPPDTASARALAFRSTSVGRSPVGPSRPAVPSSEAQPLTAIRSLHPRDE